MVLGTVCQVGASTCRVPAPQCVASRASRWRKTAAGVGHDWVWTIGAPAGVVCHRYDVVRVRVGSRAKRVSKTRSPLTGGSWAGAPTNKSRPETARRSAAAISHVSIEASSTMTRSASSRWTPQPQGPARNRRWTVRAVGARAAAAFPVVAQRITRSPRAVASAASWRIWVVLPVPGPPVRHAYRAVRHSVSADRGSAGGSAVGVSGVSPGNVS